MSESIADIRFATVKQWCAISGMGRTSTFAAIKQGHLVTYSPPGVRTLIDVQKGIEWIRSHPIRSYQSGQKRAQ